jgi:hypothetical protein
MSVAVVERLKAAGIRAVLLDDGRLWVGPLQCLTAETRWLVSAHVAELRAVAVRPDGLWSATCPECGSTCPILPGGDRNAPCGLHAPLSAPPRRFTDWEE